MEAKGIKHVRSFLASDLIYMNWIKLIKKNDSKKKIDIKIALSFPSEKNQQVSFLSKPRPVAKQVHHLLPPPPPPHPTTDVDVISPTSPAVRTNTNGVIIVIREADSARKCRPCTLLVKGPQVLLPGMSYK